MAVPPARRGVAGALLPPATALAAVGMAVLMATATGHPAAVLPAAAVAAAALAVGYTPAGATFPGRVALGVVLVAAAVAIMGVMFLVDGRDPAGLAYGAAFLVASVALLFSGRVDTSPRPVTAYAPAVAAVAGALLLAIQYLGASGAVAALWHGGLALLLAVLLAVASAAGGPARFALGALGVALSAALLYFLAITGPGAAAVAVAAVVTVAAVAGIGPLDKSRSAESSDGGPRVR
ncbi:hypothetical protein [Actinokineospora sp. NPDC004072]